MKNGRREKIKAGKVMEETRGQEVGPGRLVSTMSRGEGLDPEEIKKKKKVMFSDIHSSHAGCCS